AWGRAPGGRRGRRRPAGGWAVARGKGRGAGEVAVAWAQLPPTLRRRERGGVVVRGKGRAAGEVAAAWAHLPPTLGCRGGRGREDGAVGDEGRVFVIVLVV